MSENQPGPIHSQPLPGLASAPDVEGEAQTRVAAAPFQLSQDPLTGEPTPDGPSANGSLPAPAYEHLGELPASYGTQSVYLVAYDPRQLFAYWDLDPSHGAAKKYALHVCRPDGEIEHRVDILPSEAGRYLAATRPGGTYYVELGTHGRDGSWQTVASSGRVTLPPEGLAGETEPKFATLPFHLSFQRLMELIDGAMGSKEHLTAALARLQRGERPVSASLLGALAHLSAEQLHTLEMLLGQKFALDSEASLQAGSHRLVFRDKHEALTSGGLSSETLSAARAAGSEALSSGALAMGSEALSSGAFGSEVTITPVSSETFTSFFSGPGLETLSSSTVGLGSEALSSFTVSHGSESLAAFSGLSSESLLSVSRGGLSSESLASLAAGLGGESLSSGGVGSETLLSLLMGMSSESLSSFFAAFAGGSETLSSGLGAGPSSEAWRLAASGPGPFSGDVLSSDRATMFLHAVESNLDTLSSLFSHAFSSLDSGSSPGHDGSSGSLGGPGGGGGGSSGSGSSENLARKKSLW